MSGIGRAHISNENKEMIRSIFNIHHIMSLGIAATEVGLHRMTVRNFPKRECARYPYKLRMRQEMNYLGKQNRIPFSRHCLSELRDHPGFLKLVALSNECKVLLLELPNKQNFWV